MDAITDLNAEQTESITTVVAGIHSLDSESAAESLEETLAAAEAGAELAYAAQYVLASSGYFLSTALAEVTYVAQAGGAYLAWNITDSQAEKTYLRLEETAATARDAGIVEINAEQWTREQDEFATLLTSAAEQRVGGSLCLPKSVCERQCLAVKIHPRMASSVHFSLNHITRELTGNAGNCTLNRLAEPVAPWPFTPLQLKLLYEGSNR